MSSKRKTAFSLNTHVFCHCAKHGGRVEGLSQLELNLRSGVVQVFGEDEENRGCQDKECKMRYLRKTTPQTRTR